MSEKSLTFRELIELIDMSVKSGKIQKDYPYFLKTCRDLGISSYILNTIIIKAKEDSNNKDDDDHGGKADCAFFISSKPKRKKKKDDSQKEIQIVTKIQRKNSKTAWLLTAFLLCCCVAEGIYMYDIFKDRKRAWRKNDIINNENAVLRRRLATISNMTSDFPVDLSFSDWESYNHSNNSESSENYRFTASKGDKLSFDYYVSSEYNFDFLTITLSGDSITSKKLVKKSGVSEDSYVFEFEKGGEYKLQAKYSKDHSYNRNNDLARVTNICIHRNYKNILENIHLISDSIAVE